jgi:tRNA dimethylallyltransferase
MGSASSQLQPLFLVGPTAVGKSEVALLLAELLRGEIITVDSMQAYRGLDIGTAKPTAAEQARVPHHLLDVAELHEPFDAGKFVALAQAVVAGIQSRGRLPIFCGGTGLYVKAFVDGLGQAPPSDPVIRAELEATPLDTMLSELSEHDPVTYARIDKQNPRRVIRALEVIRITGQTFSAQRAEWRSTEGVAAAASPDRILGLARASEDLRARIDARVDQMFTQGLVAETRSLLTRGLEKNPIAMQAIGYRQVVEHLRGERSLEATIELVKTRTRQFAKRQMTWFRRQLSVQWLEVRPGEPASEITSRLEALMGAERP